MGYFYTLVNQMMEGNQDKLNSQTTAHSFEDETVVNMVDYNFLPSYEIRLSQSKDSFRKFHKENPGVLLFDPNQMADDAWYKNFDIGNIDIETLNRIFRMQLKVKIIGGGQVKHLKANFRRCKEEDYTLKGISKEDVSHGSFLKRFCP